MSEQTIVNKVPCLQTSLTGPLLELERQFLAKQVAIEAWFRQQWLATPPPINCSVDCRNSGFKLAPIDTNLFPAGFNNLNPELMPLAIQAVRTKVAEINPEITKILLLPESHTRNQFYLENLAVLHSLICKAGYEVRIGFLDQTLSAAKTIALPSGKQVLLEPIVKRGDKVSLADFEPDLLWLNNDLSSGMPALLEHVSQPIHPPPSVGWHRRLKSQHFAYYQQLAQQFAEVVDIDPWLITPYFETCNNVDFVNQLGLSGVKEQVQAVLAAVQEKYQQYNIQQQPYVVVKADAGTYGMGVMVVKDISELDALSRKQRNKMAATKGNKPIDSIIIQEGVYTFEKFGDNNASAEPVVYMLGEHVVGGFYRFHPNKSSTDNLNAPGMAFQSLAFVNTCLEPDPSKSPDECVNRFYAYGVIGRLAALAAAHEVALARKESDYVR